MKVLLRSTSTGLFFQGPDQWTPHPDRAHNFKLIDRALKFTETWSLREVELAFAFHNPLYVAGAPLDRMAATYHAD